MLRAIRAARPETRAIVIADQAHVPYGGRPLDEIQAFGLAQCEFLFDAGVEQVWMACNICSAVALPEARRRHGADRVHGVVEAGCEAAVQASSKGRIGVLATEGTVRSGAYEATLKALDPAVQVTTVACPEFVPLVEAGLLRGPAAEAAARRRLEPLIDAGCDVLVHGCTHYPFLQDVLTLCWPGPAPSFVDPAQALAQRQGPSLPIPPESSEDRYCTTGDPWAFSRQLMRFVRGTSSPVTALMWSEGRLHVDATVLPDVVLPRGA